MAKFKKGDIVILKSGGHPMIIKSVQGSKIICIWRDKKTEDYQEKEFEEFLLEKYKNSEKKSSIFLEVINSKTGEKLKVDTSSVNLKELTYLEEENIHSSKLKKIIDNLSISAEAKALLWEIGNVVMKIGEKVIKIGQKILELVIFFAQKYPNTTIGMIVGGVIGMTISSIPIVGWAIGGLVTPLLTALGLAYGFWNDMQDKMLQNNIKNAVNEVFGGLKNVTVPA